jgi:hypothetical protein
MVSANIVELSPMAEQFISETFLLLLTGLGLEDDETNYQTLEDLLGIED